MQLSGPVGNRGSLGGICLSERETKGYGEKLLVKTTSQCLDLCCHTNRDGDAWLSSLTALITVDPIAEGADARGEGREGEIVVVPLPKQGHHVSELSVADHACICCA